MKKAKAMPVEDAPKKFSYDLRAIYFRKSSIALEDIFNPLLPDQELSGSFECKQDGYITSGIRVGENAIEIIQSITCRNQYDFSYLLAGQQDQKSSSDTILRKAAASISAQICVDYVVTSGQPTMEELAAMANSSILHSWPYWREYCHSNMARMQLPVIQVPLLHVQTLEHAVDPTLP